MIITAELDQSEYQRIDSALDSIIRLLESEQEDLPYRHAVRFADFVRWKITSGAYKQPPLNERYKEWKAQYGDFQRNWMLMGDLVLAITVFKDEEGWRAGIPAGVYDSGGKSWFGKGDRGEPKEIAMYGLTIEFGGGNQRFKRPVFVPATRDFRKDEMPKQIQSTQNEIARRWR